MQVHLAFSSWPEPLSLHLILAKRPRREEPLSLFPAGEGLAQHPRATRASRVSTGLSAAAGFASFLLSRRNLGQGARLPCGVFLVMHHGGGAEDRPPTPGPSQGRHPVGDIETTQDTIGQRHRRRGAASCCRYKPD